MFSPILFSNDSGAIAFQFDEDINTVVNCSNGFIVSVATEGICQGFVLQFPADTINPVILKDPSIAETQYFWIPNLTQYS
jgi:hypothetical protein